jgi:hypothetical protein
MASIINNASVFSVLVLLSHYNSCQCTYVFTFTIDIAWQLLQEHSYHRYVVYVIDKHIGSSGLPEIDIVNHKGKARVVCILTVECISVVNHYSNSPMLYDIVACIVL